MEIGKYFDMIMDFHIKTSWLRQKSKNIIWDATTFSISVC